MKEKQLYASLTGPLIGLYYPIGDDEGRGRLALNESKLEKLWCSVYTESQVDEQITQFGGMKLPANYVRRIL
jgi:hypothetical protein